MKILTTKETIIEILERYLPTHLDDKEIGKVNLESVFPEIADNIIILFKNDVPLEEDSPPPTSAQCQHKWIYCHHNGTADCQEGLSRLFQCSECKMFKTENGL